MELKPHSVDQWLQQYAEPGLEFDLGSSTGPHWTLRELLAIHRPELLERLLDTELAYSRTAGRPALRRAIAEMLGVAAEQVVVLAGAAEALWHVFLVAAEPGANVIIPFPCFPPHRTLPEGLGFEVRSYHLRRDNSYRVDLDEIKAMIDSNTKILLVNLPNNPTGAALSDGEMESLHDLALERGVQFVCDEVHHPIYHGQTTSSASGLSHATAIGDFSKAFSLPGIRLGWVVESDERRREQYLNAREYVTISNSPLTELIAEVAVEHRDTIWDRTREATYDNLKLLDGLFDDYSNVLRWVRPQGGMTCFPWLADGTNALEFCKVAAQHGLLLVPGNCFDVPDHFRLGFGLNREWFPKAVDRLAAFIDSWQLAGHP